MNKLKLLYLLFGMMHIGFSKGIDLTLIDVKGKSYPVQEVPANCQGCAYCHMNDVKAIFKKKYGFEPKYIQFRNQTEIFRQIDGTYKKVLPDNYLLMSGTYYFTNNAPSVSQEEYETQENNLRNERFPWLRFRPR